MRVQTRLGLWGLAPYFSKRPPKLHNQAVLSAYYHVAVSLLWDHLLAHLDRDKMDNIFQTTFSNALSWMKTYQSILIKISLKFVPKAPIDNIPALV